MPLNVITTNDVTKLDKQIKALEYQLEKDANEKDIKIHTAAIKKLKEELLFRQYLELHSKEFKKDIIGYEKLIMSGKDLSIKVNFTWGWLHVYKINGGQIEWY